MLVRFFIFMSCFASVKGERNYDFRLLTLERKVHLDMKSLNESIKELYVTVKNSSIWYVNNIGNNFTALQDKINSLNILKRGFYEEKRLLRERTELLSLILKQISQNVKSTNEDLETKIDSNEKQIIAVNHTLADVTKSLHSTSGQVQSFKEMIQRQTQSLSTKISSLSIQLEKTLERLIESEETNAKLFNAMYLLHGDEKWIIHGKSLYYISSGIATWQEAKYECRKRGAYLVEIMNSEEQAFLRGLAYTHFGYQHVWIGGTDADHEGTWIWDHSRQRMPLSSYWWLAGQPDNWLNEDCAHLNKDGNYLWNDTPCSTRMAYFCQKAVL